MILARFSDLAALQEAAGKMRGQGGRRVEIFSPYEIEGEGGSVVPLVILLAGLAGAGGFFLLQAYADVIAWPMNIGGRPSFAWPAYVGNAFEVGVLCAMAAGSVALFAAAGLPRLFATVDRFSMFREATRNGFFLLLDTPDPAADRALLAEMRPLRLEEMA